MATATLSSSNTRAQAINAYRDNLSYRTEESLTKAYAFREAILWLMQDIPTESRQGGPGGQQAMNMGENLRQYAKLLDEVDEFISANQASSNTVIHADFTEFRT